MKFLRKFSLHPRVGLLSGCVPMGVAGPKSEKEKGWAEANTSSLEKRIC